MCYEWGPFIKVNEPLKHYFIYLFYFLHYLGPFFVFFVCLLQFLSLKIHKTYELNWWQNRWFSHRGRIQLPLDVSQALTTVLQGGSDPSYSQTRLYLDWLGTRFYTLKYVWDNKNWDSEIQPVHGLSRTPWSWNTARTKGQRVVKGSQLFFSDFHQVSESIRLSWKK